MLTTRVFEIRYFHYVDTYPYLYISGTQLDTHMLLPDTMYLDNISSLLSLYIHLHTYEDVGMYVRSMKLCTYVVTKRPHHLESTRSLLT